jgi:S1-C subfamily serine protease
MIRVGIRVGIGVGFGSLLACASWLPAEPVETRVVLWFDQFDEVFTGNATRAAAMLSGSFVDVTNHHRDIRCVGRSVARVVPPDARPPKRCDGMTGSVTLSCSDGRSLELEVNVEEGCRTGYGRGSDDEGHPLHAAFGGTAAHATAMAREAREHLAGSDRLPLPRADGPNVASTGVSTGTAFFVSWEGHLVTNHHVVDGHDKIQVQVEPGELIDAEVIALDEENDLALLRVDAIGQPLALRAEGALVKGEDVFALGYPLVAIQGQEQKATFGRVNALSGVKGDERYAQVDVPIQPGNSGGPLIDKRGEVVGVVTSMLHQQQVLEMAGVIPQNVNYALKARYVEAVLASELGDDWTPAARAKPEHEFSELVSAAQDSVVLVVAW